MLGALFGDLVGSIYEFNNIVGNTTFPLISKNSSITDDSICTIACMDWLIHGGDPAGYLRDWCNGYPAAGYGPLFHQWLTDKNAGPYGSSGNGAIMRISPVALWCSNIENMYDNTKKFTKPTHNHPDSIVSACLLNGLIRQAVAGARMEQLLQAAELVYGDTVYAEIDDLYHRTPPFFNVHAKGTLYQALICFFRSNSFEEAIRLSISIGGDSDTIASACGALAEAYYGFPPIFEETLFKHLPFEMRKVVFEYYSKRAIRNKFLDIRLLDVEFVHNSFIYNKYESDIESPEVPE